MRLIILLIACCISINLSGQSKKQKEEEYIITLKNDTVFGNVVTELPCGIGSPFFCKIKFKDVSGNPRTYSADEIKGFQSKTHFGQGFIMNEKSTTKILPYF